MDLSAGLSNNDRNMEFPILSTKRLNLREFRLSDKDALFRIFEDEEVTRYYNISAFQSMEDCLALLERRRVRFYKGRGISWAITMKDNDSLIGNCSFNAFLKQRTVGEIGYELKRPFWNQGIMTEALTAIIQYGFEIIGLRQIEAWVIPGNIGSMRVLTKLNFQWLGLQKNKGYWDGKHHDLEQWTVDS